LPVGEPEAPRQFVADPGGILGRQHQRDAPGGLPGDRIDGGFRRVSRHPARVTEAEVDELVPVDVKEAGAFRAIDEYRMVARPARHPVHRHAEK
jgi:hypothetical protein